MTLKEITDAVNSEQTVYWIRRDYRVVKDHDDYWITHEPTGSRVNLVWQDGSTLYGQEGEFWVHGDEDYEYALRLQIDMNDDAIRCNANCCTAAKLQMFATDCHPRSADLLLSSQNEYDLAIVAEDKVQQQKLLAISSSIRIRVVLDSLQYLVEYLRFHTAESADWDALLPEHKSILERCEATIQKATTWLPE